MRSRREVRVEFQSTETTPLCGFSIWRYRRKTSLGETTRRHFSRFAAKVDTGSSRPGDWDRTRTISDRVFSLLQESLRRAFLGQEAKKRQAAVLGQATALSSSIEFRMSLLRLSRLRLLSLWNGRRGCYLLQRRKSANLLIKKKRTGDSRATLTQRISLAKILRQKRLSLRYSSFVHFKILIISLKKQPIFTNA